MVSPSRCPPWQPERPGPTRREPRRAQRSYTTRRDTIIGFADFIEKEIFGPIGNEKYAEYISDVHASAEHLLDLVNDILDISTIEAGEMALTPEMLDLATMFDECARVVREQAHKAELTLSIALPDRDASVYADHRAVRQILLNLLSNAIKFTPPGGEVTLGAVASEENFTISVSDTGVGIPAQYNSTITQPFETGSDDPHTSTKGNPYPLASTMALRCRRSLGM